jgi:hypothetical protein
MRPGTFFVTFTKGLTSKLFEVLERKRYRMSWGPATGKNRSLPLSRLIIILGVRVQYLFIDVSD